LFLRVIVALFIRLIVGTCSKQNQYQNDKIQPPLSHISTPFYQRLCLIIRYRMIAGKSTSRFLTSMIPCCVMRMYGKWVAEDRKSTRLNSSHVSISYAVFCCKEKI